MSLKPSVRILVRTAFGLAALALAACGASTPSASNPTTPAAKAQAACTVAAAMVPINAKFTTASTQVGVFRPSNPDLKCASGIARVTVLIGPVNAPLDRTQASEHLVLLMDKDGRWIIANEILCNSQGYPTRKTPPELGVLCGFQ